MLIKNSRRLAALTLAILLALCAGCGSSAEPAADTPAPSQTAATPEPTTSPDAGQAPVPEAAATPSDIDAPAPAGPLPALENPIEREAPDSLQLLTLGASFTVTNAEGQTLTRGASGFSGTMTFTQQQLSDAGGDIVSVLIPYSTGFTFETPDVSGDWGFEILATACPWCHCLVKGSGKLDGFDYDTGSSLTVRTEPGTELELTLPMAGSYLGESGWVRLRLTAGESEVSLNAEADGNGFSYSGIDTESSAMFDYGGFRSNEGFDISSSTGSVGFSSIWAGSTAS